MKYEHRFEVRAPLSIVAAFHREAHSLALITPPPIVVRINAAPDELRQDSDVDFTMWFGPFPVRWMAGIEDLHDGGFVDRQIAGPFASWSHRHEFVSLDERRTEVVDRVDARLRPHLLWGPVGLGMWISLPLLFAFRQWNTKRLLEGGR